MAAVAPWLAGRWLKQGGPAMEPSAVLELPGLLQEVLGASPPRGRPCGPVGGPSWAGPPGRRLLYRCVV